MLTQQEQKIISESRNKETNVNPRLPVPTKNSESINGSINTFGRGTNKSRGSSIFGSSIMAAMLSAMFVLPSKHQCVVRALQVSPNYRPAVVRSFGTIRTGLAPTSTAISGKCNLLWRGDVRQSTYVDNCGYLQDRMNSQQL